PIIVVRRPCRRGRRQQRNDGHCRQDHGQVRSRAQSHVCSPHVCTSSVHTVSSLGLPSVLPVVRGRSRTTVIIQTLRFTVMVVTPSDRLFLPLRADTPSWDVRPCRSRTCTGPHCLGQARPAGGRWFGDSSLTFAMLDHLLDLLLH